jgi:hypothetical protein
MPILRRVSSIATVAAALAAFAGAVGCGPNYRTAFEGDAMFDRCQNTDRDPQAMPDDRLQCWGQYSQYYSTGQPPERVQLAQRRVNELRNGPPNGPSSGGQAQPPGPGQPPQQQPPPGYAQQQPGQPQPAGFTGTAGAPQPPPGWPQQQQGQPQQPVAQQTPPANPNVAAGTNAANASANGGPPGGSCSSSCREAWTGCNGGCSGEAACVARCDDSYRDCMRGCY